MKTNLEISHEEAQVLLAALRDAAYSSSGFAAHHDNAEAKARGAAAWELAQRISLLPFGVIMYAVRCMETGGARFFCHRCVARPYDLHKVRAGMEWSFRGLTLRLEKLAPGEPCKCEDCGVAT